MPIIEAHGLTKIYRVTQKKEGFLLLRAQPFSQGIQGSSGRR